MLRFAIVALLVIAGCRRSRPEDDARNLAAALRSGHRVTYVSCVDNQGCDPSYSCSAIYEDGEVRVVSCAYSRSGCSLVGIGGL